MGVTNLIHGHNRHGNRRSPTYNSWRAMVERCEYERHPYYWLYGGRGITVAPALRSFAGFLAELGERPPGMTLDRKDPDGHYEPGNVRWATPREQYWNRRTMAVAREEEEQWIHALAG